MVDFIGRRFLVFLVTGWLLGNSFENEDVIQGFDRKSSRVMLHALEDTTITYIPMERQAVRASFQLRKNCSKWTSWINENHPSLALKEDTEFISNTTMRNFCPIGIISKLECKDNKGEPFHGNFTANDKSYFISCSNIMVGVKCMVLNSTRIKFCPDMSVRYYCSCPPLNSSSTTFPVLVRANRTVSGSTSSTPSTPTTTTTRKIKPSETLIFLTSSQTNEMKLFPSTTESYPLKNIPKIIGTSSSERANHTKTGGFYKTETKLNIGSISVQWWIFLLIVAGTSCILNTGITIFLYYRLKGRLTKKNSKKTVHPFQLI